MGCYELCLDKGDIYSDVDDLCSAQIQDAGWDGWFVSGSCEIGWEDGIMRRLLFLLFSSASAVLVQDSVLCLLK